MVVEVLHVFQIKASNATAALAAAAESFNAMALALVQIQHLQTMAKIVETVAP